MAAKDKNVQPRGVSPIEVSPRLVEPKAIKYPFGGTPPTPPTPTIDPTWLYFTMPEGGTVTLTKNGSPTAVTLDYSLDNGSTWTEWTESGGVRTLTLNAGQTMHVRNTSATSTGFNSSSSDYYQFSFNADTYAGGNIMSLLCADPSISTMISHCFRNLFKNCTSLITPADIRGVTTIEISGCFSMYQGCTSLIAAGDMSGVTKIEASGCRSMYQGCTSLSIAADMRDVNTIGYNSCNSMYRDCTSLTEAPDITGVTVIAESGCQAMFYGCTRLSFVKIGNPDISASNSLNSWLYNVSSTGDFYCDQNLTIPTGASGIPIGWTRHDI